MGRSRDPKSLPYRPCVGIMLLNSEDHVFVAQRINAPGAWQMPQGGIDKGEEPRAAAFREMEEEIGTANAALIQEMDHWVSYDLPEHLIGVVWKGKYRGQTQRWVALRFLGSDDEIRIDTDEPEFDAWKWVEMADLPNLIVPFKREIYKEVVAAFRHLVS